MKSVIIVVLALAITVPAFATGNGAPSGTHYNLNIIGVDKGKTAEMTGSDRHTIFVALGKAGTVASTSSIYLTPGDYGVCDGNAFDAAFDCDGNQTLLKGAMFRLPCNTADLADVTCDNGVASASYNIWARALGTPGGHAIITACATDDTGAVICSTENTLDSLSRAKPGKQTFTNVTKQLTSLTGCYDVNGSVVCQTVPLFSSDLKDFFWQYDNFGLRLAQLRFYNQ